MEKQEGEKKGEEGEEKMEEEEKAAEPTVEAGDKAVVEEEDKVVIRLHTNFVRWTRRRFLCPYLFVCGRN